MVVRFALSEEYYARLENEAQNAHMSLQDYIRRKLFDEPAIFTVDRAVERIINGNFEGTEFTLPDVFGDVWTTHMSREQGAGALGKQFYNYIEDHPELGIRFIPGKTINRRAVYTYSKQEE